MYFKEAMKAFDLAFMFTEGDSNIIHVLLLVKASEYFSHILPASLCFQAIALFTGNRHKEAMMRIEELTAACPNADTLACDVVKVSIMHSVSSVDTHFTHQAYLLVQMGINASNDARHSEAADHFTAAISTGVLSSKWEIHSQYEVFVVVCSYDSTQNAFHAQLRALCSSLDGTLSHCGKLETRIGAMHFFMRADWRKPTKRIDT